MMSDTLNFESQNGDFVTAQEITGFVYPLLVAGQVKSMCLIACALVI